MNSSTDEYCFIPSRPEKSGLKSTSTAYNPRPDSIWGTGYILEEDDYNLATMVNLKFHTIYFDNYLSLCLIGSCNFIQNKDKPIFYRLYICLPYQSFHMGYYASPFISCIKCLNAFLWVTFLSMFIISCYYITFSSTYSEIVIIYIPHSFQWSSSQDERAKIIHASLLDPTPAISRAISEAKITSKGIFLYSYQPSYAFQIK